MNERWINLGKFIAVVAVLVNHTYGILYMDTTICNGSFFSVSLFVLLMGVSTYWSYDNSKIELGKKVGKRVLGIVCPYVVSVIAYYAVSERFLDFKSILEQVFSFNITGPHYYVLQYVQLLIVSPVIFLVIKTTGKLKFINKIVCRVLFGAGLLVFGALSIHRSNVLDVFGGGGKLFGGTYLFLLYLGMLVGSGYHWLNRANNVYHIVGLCISTVCTFVAWRFICINNFAFDGKLPFGYGVNPPGISLMVYAICWMCFIYFLTKTMEMLKNKYINKALGPIEWLGKHTLYIFLYHRLFLDYFYRVVNIRINFWLDCIICFTIMIGGSLLIEIVCRYVWKSWICAGYLYKGGKLDNEA